MKIVTVQNNTASVIDNYVKKGLTTRTRKKQKRDPQRLQHVTQTTGAAEYCATNQQNVIRRMHRKKKLTRKCVPVRNKKPDGVETAFLAKSLVILWYK